MPLFFDGKGGRMGFPSVGPWPIFWALAIVLVFISYVGPLALARTGLVSRSSGRTVTAYLIAWTLIIAIWAGFYAVAHDSELKGSSEAASLTALGLLVAGVLVGFMFALPRALDSQPALNSSDPSVRLKANTNLEKVSDWLTTVITGVGLTQLVKLPDYLHRFADFLSEGFVKHVATGGATPSQSLVATALGISIHFPIVGFLSGYIATRTVLTRAFDDADRSLIGERERKNVDKPPALLEVPDPSSGDAPTPEQLQAARSIASADPATLQTVDEQASFARALTILGRPHDALTWFAKALNVTPDDQRLLEQYAAALYADPKSDPYQIVPVLKRALALVKPDDPRSRARISTNLVVTYLYIDDGFLQALTLANEMDEDDKIEKRPILFFYRACALGQLYDALKMGRAFKPPIPTDPEAVTGAIFDDTKLAVRLQPSLKARFHFVSTAHVAEPGVEPSKDTDLVAFANDHPAYRDLFEN